MNTIEQSETNTFKSASRAQWNQAASGWNDHTPQLRVWLARATQAMLDMAGVRNGSRVLDVAAGAGDQTLEIAVRVGSEGSVCATDLSPAILDFARTNAERAGLRNVETRVADGERLPLDDESFDAAVCRLGLMLFPDPARGLEEMHRVLKPGSGVCTVVFSRPEANPCVTILMSTALRHAGLAPRDPFQPGGLLSLGRPGRIDELFAAAGFRAVATTRLEAPFRLPSARDYLTFVKTSASPIQQILGKLDEKATDSAWAEMEERLQVYQTADGWVGPNELLLTAGRR